MQKGFQIRPDSDSEAIARLLSALAVGEEVSYHDLTAAIGRDVQTVARAAMERARYRLERDERRVFGVVLGIGLRRLNDREIVATSDKARAHIRRTSRRAARTVLCSDYAALPREDQTKHNTALSVFGILEQMAGDKAYRRIEHGVRESGSTLTDAKAAALALKDVG
jgi:hypothetical protein